MHNSLEDQHYDFCQTNLRAHLHYVCPDNDWEIFMTKEKLDELELMMLNFITTVAICEESNTDKLWELLPLGVSRYGLLDYVGSGCIPLGAEALVKLGYRAHSEKPPKLLSDHPYDSDDPEEDNEERTPTVRDLNTHRIYFFHPDRPTRPIYYEDIKNHDFCTLWQIMNDLVRLMMEGWPLHLFDYPVEILPRLWLCGILCEDDLPSWCNKNKFTQIINIIDYVNSDLNLYMWDMYKFMQNAYISCWNLLYTVYGDNLEVHHVYYTLL